MRVEPGVRRTALLSVQLTVAFHSLTPRLNRPLFLGDRDELGRMAVETDLFVVGGAAMIRGLRLPPGNDRRRCRIRAFKELRTAAWRVAEELGLEEDCLNDGVKGFLWRNDRCRPFVWNRTPVKILSHARRRPTLDARH